MKGKDLAERIYKMMKNDLMLDKWDPYEMYNEQTFADMYGCSRTPAREAAGRLVLEGYLNKYPSKGYIIRVPSETEVKELRECRYALECYVIESIIDRATDEEINSLRELSADTGTILYTNNLQFHLKMAELTGNQKIVEMIENLLYLLVRPLIVSRYPSFKEYADKVKAGGNPLTEDHEKIIEALLERNVTRTKELLKEDMFPHYGF